MDKRKIVKTGYDQCAVDYAKSRDLFKNKKYLEDLAARLFPGAKVLDLGCGSGVPIDKFLAERGFPITGVDVSVEMIKLAKKNLPAAEYAVGDMAAVNFPLASFDAVVSFYAIFHLSREEHSTLLKKIYRFLRPGGLLLITMGSSDWEGIEDFHGAKMFWSHYGEKENLAMVKKAGFQIISSEIDLSGGEKHLVILARKRD